LVSIPREESMMNLNQELINILNEFEETQKEHCIALASGSLNAIMTWNDTRTRIFSQLQICLLKAGKDAQQIQESMPEFIRKKIQDLLSGEDHLKQLLSKQKEILAGKMNGIRKGRKALKGYQSNNTSAYGYGKISKPQFLSSTT
jgi:hypothetical protein